MAEAFETHMSVLLGEEMIAASKTRQTLLLLVFLFLVVVFLEKFGPIGPDFYYVFMPVTRRFFAGKTLLYDETSFGFYNAPWAVFVIAPFAILPLTWGQALWSVFTLTGILFFISRFLSLCCRVSGPHQRRILAVTLALVNLHTVDLILRGNMEGFLAWGLGFLLQALMTGSPLWLGLGWWLLSMKPINVLIPSALSFLYVLQTDSKHTLLKGLLPFVTTFALSFFIFGHDWPVRYWVSFSQHPPMTEFQTSLWRAFHFFGLSKEEAKLLNLFLFFVGSACTLWIFARNRFVPHEWMALGLATNLLFSPYTLGSHYVLLSPVLAWLVYANPAFALIWLTTWTPLLRLFFGVQVAWMDLIYPLTLWISTWWLLLLRRPS